MSAVMSGAEILVKCLQAENVDTIFGYPGGSVLHIYDELFKQDKIHHVLVRHEQAAVHAADAGTHQMRGGQRTHGPRTDDDGRAARQAVQLDGGLVQRHRHHRRARGVDTGLGVHPLADRQRSLRKFVEGS